MVTSADRTAHLITYPLYISRLASSLLALSHSLQVQQLVIKPWTIVESQLRVDVRFHVAHSRDFRSVLSGVDTHLEYIYTLPSAMTTTKTSSPPSPSLFLFICLFDKPHTSHSPLLTLNLYLPPSTSSTKQPTSHSSSHLPSPSHFTHLYLPLRPTNQLATHLLTFDTTLCLTSKCSINPAAQDDSDLSVSSLVKCVSPSPRAQPRRLRSS
ncbi:hypothetical protein HDK77DRAFT_287575 [Phyllosticta capitalensis]|uniref:Uncharacterized protein n=1 Tax=Phyllosticta capitalensis TaxID=121624 RepID=A0ABR1YGG5_9PEZI